MDEKRNDAGSPAFTLIETPAPAAEPVSFEMLPDENRGAVIKVVGVGGAGNNAINHMIARGVKGVDFIAINTDSQALDHSRAPVTIQLGEHGRGGGAIPAAGRAAAEMAVEQIREQLRGAEMVFLAAGMGKGTGTGATPVVAQVAQELGLLTVGVVTKPFRNEGAKKMRVAEEGIEELVAHVDSLIVVLNEKLFDVMPEDASLEEAFHCANDVLHNAVAGIAEIINVRGMVNVDFADVRTIMSEQGRAMMGVGEASGIDRARLAAEQAVASPLLDEEYKLAAARGVIVNISASRNLKLREVNEIINTVRDFCDEDATIIHGTVVDESLGDTLRVTVVATGIGRAHRRPQLVPDSVRRTGTDDAPMVQQGDATRNPQVWRNPRAEAASTVQALRDGGMDRYDIPAFLRRQAD